MYFWNLDVIITVTAATNSNAELENIRQISYILLISYSLPALKFKTRK